VNLDGLLLHIHRLPCRAKIEISTPLPLPSFNFDTKPLSLIIIRLEQLNIHSKMAAERERQPYAMTVDRQESLPDECQQKEQSDVRNSASMAELLGLMHLSINNEARVERSGGRMVPSKEVKCHFQTSTVFADRRPWVPEGVFHLKKLPQELRMKIYAHELYHLPVSKEPALLQVLAKDKFLLDDYRRAIRLWEYGGMHNFKVTSANVDTFHRMPMKDMMKIKHLTIVVDAPGAPLK